MTARFYPAQVVRWLDGDTLEVDIDQGFNGRQREHVRLLDYDAPESHQPLHDAATARAEELAPIGAWVTLESHKNSARSFIRWLGRIHLDDGRDVAKVLEAEGLTKEVALKLQL
ncbi:nuclease [Arthrobacter phage Wyborn]|uniref:Nuclease n=1 Tax=Arthrobacter phage Wyborn TaxID=3059067 RepID=A0AA96K074_9CAUD|nr:nuclease [Arthrobacter phage Wyborn]